MERYIPIYFATLLLKNKEDAIKLSIPPEIKNTVDELISMVKDCLIFLLYLNYQRTKFWF